jgi:hypothetical protein
VADLPSLMPNIGLRHSGDQQPQDYQMRPHGRIVPVGAVRSSPNFAARLLGGSRQGPAG